VAAPALDGLKVVDLSQIGAGPYLGSLLGDLGANVIKVEPPEGEPFRRIDQDFGPGESSYFFGINRSKRSVTLDLKSPHDFAIFRRLVKWSDVLIVSMRPDAIRRLKIDYDSLSRLNRKLIYCSITAFGETGPRASEPGMDILAQAMGGLMGTTGEPGRPPVKVGPPVSDFVTSFVGGFGILAALQARQRDGVGQKVSVSLLDSTIALLANYVTPYFKTGVEVKPVGGGHPQLVPYQVFSVDDGFIVVACLNDRFWQPLCEAIGKPELAAIPQYRTNVFRVANREQLIGILAPIFLSRSRAEWIARLTAHGVPCGPVHSLKEVFEDEQVKHNKMLLELEHPIFGRYVTTNNPIRLSRSRVRPTGHAPGLGEHNLEVLEELAREHTEE
jgi:crotonobetainyl-CoA:carnitine CoA-transferase CaiB-like acyl-CoA transferase